MDKKEIIDRLEKLSNEIKDYAKYLEESTYHPYEQVENFGYELKTIIDKMKDN